MKNQLKNSVIALCIATTISLISCGNTDKKESRTDNVNAATKEVVENGQVAVADISFKNENGKTISLRSLKGKVVFINFWATWCGPCIHEMPSINNLKQLYKGNKTIEFLMVDVDNKMAKSSAFMLQNKYDLPVFVPTGNIPSEYLGNSIPTTVILDKSGDIIARIEGGRDYMSPEIITALNELIESN